MDKFTLSSQIDAVYMITYISDLYKINKLLRDPRYGQLTVISMTDQYIAIRHNLNIFDTVAEYKQLPLNINDYTVIDEEEDEPTNKE